MGELDSRLQDQMAFLDASCEAYDRRNAREALRLATTIRVLVHDTSKSHSLLEQLQVKDEITYVDGHSAMPEDMDPIGPNAVHSAPGLAVIAHFYSSEGGSRDASEYWPAFRADSGSLAEKPRVSFETWWKSVVSIDTLGNRQFRRHFILAGANKDGGAHIDTTFSGEYEAYRSMTRDGSMGTVSQGSYVSVGNSAAGEFGMSPALAVIRHIAEELRVSLRLQLASSLGDLATAPPEVEMEKPFMFSGDSQTSLPQGFTIELGPQPA
jgi:hypothetical protein